MQSDLILCELLAEEGLVERLYEKRVAMGVGPGPYEGLLLEEHAVYVVRCLVDDAVESFNRASKCLHYGAAARSLAHVRELPGGEDVACEVADLGLQRVAAPVCVARRDACRGVLAVPQTRSVVSAQAAAMAILPSSTSTKSPS